MWAGGGSAVRWHALPITANAGIAGLDSSRPNRFVRQNVRCWVLCVGRRLVGDVIADRPRAIQCDAVHDQNCSYLPAL